MTATAPTPAPRDPELLGQTVAVIGGSPGTGLVTAKRAGTLWSSRTLLKIIFSANAPPKKPSEPTPATSN